ncbi:MULTISPECIES: two-component regulator propeller domain-containing protein [Empedobacter]|uniref:type IX secretion system anionic LPS delivery protein PorZ n=1 Tax=Empedobacter TaxID=59734 RepID=UPI002575361D|nr:MULTISPECIES: two-component regulator propeller domain-containing protein [Empedobacter]MDM1040877.1 T9SS type A sorting domain-containing protein [Empedobacter brevis]MDM1134458.1 T9SS type A sorting domain-containing protein [Empedobacter sp. R750]
MKTKLFIFITMIFTSLNAQNDKVRWTDLFSYNNVKLLEEVNGVIYCGTENGIFLFNPQNPTSDWIKLNKTNFLNNVGVSAMAYDKDSDSFLVGYENGGLDLLKSGESTMVLDIKWNGFSGDKKVNHIFINDGIAFISGAFGIVSYDLKEEEFKETTRTNSAKIDDVTILNIVVNDATILNNKLYIATSKGIFSSELTSKKLNNPNINLWTVQNLNQNVSNIELFEKEIYYSVENELKTISGTPVSEAFNFIEDLKLSNEKLIITQNNQISVLGSGDYSKSEINFNTAISIGDEVYGGSVNHGIINLSNLEEFYPDGPFNNKAWSVTTKNGKVWIAPGGTESYSNVLENSDGFFYYDTKRWNNFRSKEIFDIKDILRIAAHPDKDNNTFIVSSFNKYGRDKNGRTDLLEFDADLMPKKIINNQFPSSRISGLAYDKLGNLHIGASYPDGKSPDYNSAYYVERSKNGTWKSNNVDKTSAIVALSPDFSDVYTYYASGRQGGGVTVLDKKYEIVTTMTTSNKLPINNVLTVANDKSNNLWIGTEQGLVVLYGADNAVSSNNIVAEPIVIIQDGIPEALLTDVGIYAIKVDNANNKWIATNGAGVYYVSDSGESTKLHFTSKNSPLPSDIVYDVSIDESTGKVFFATEKGVVSYNGDVSTEANNFNNAIAYPNPYRPEYKGNVTIKNLPNRALVKITDIVGNLLFEKKAEGGIVEWNTNNAKGKPVASGIYLVLMTNADGTETKTLKIAVVR